MLNLAKRKKEGWLRVEDINLLPTSALQIIDDLWIVTSKSHFGFSIQKMIYENFGGTTEFDRQIWNNFGDTVGWRINNEWVFYNNTNYILEPSPNFLYSVEPPIGFLPRRCLIEERLLRFDELLWKRWVMSIFSRF